jgi:hypothetical protein
VTYSFTITQALTPVIEITESAYPITVTSPDWMFTITQPSAVSYTISATNYTFTSTVDASYVATENLATAYRGDFVGGTSYYRGNIVRYGGAVYVATVQPDITITSATAPSTNTAQWSLIFGAVGNLTEAQINALLRAQRMNPWSSSTTYGLYDWTWTTATNSTYVLTNIGGALNKNPDQFPAFWTNVGGGLKANADGTLSNLTVTNQLTVAGVRYPTNNGNLGQVLTTNGENQAVWSDVSGLAVTTATTSQLGVIRVGLGLSVDGDGTLNVTSATQILRFWNLSDDLTTNGFSIVSGEPNTVSALTPVPQLTIGSGDRTKLKAGLVFPSRTTSTTGVANLIANSSVSMGIGLPEGSISGNYVSVSTATITASGKLTQSGGDVLLGGDVYGSTTAASLNVRAPFVRFAGTLTGTTNTDPVKVGSGGVRFSDGSTIASGNVATFNTLTVSATATINSVVVGASGIRFSDGTRQTSATTSTFNTLTVNSTATINNIVVGSTGIKFNDGTILTTTNGFGGTGTGIANIIAGQGITTSTTGTAVIVGLSTATASVIGGIKQGVGFTVNTQTAVMNLSTATTSTLGGVRIGEGLQINSSTGVLSIAFTTTFFAEAGQGITTSSNTVTGALVFGLNTATTTGIGGIKQGLGFSVNTQTAVMNLNTATAADIGGVKVGQGLNISSSTAIMSVNTATTSTLGGIKVGQGISVNTQTAVLDVTTATASSIGGIKVGLGFDINSSTAVLSLTTATSSQLGGIKVGNNLSILDGVLSASSTIGVGDVDLGKDMTTNGYAIRYNTTTNTSTFIQLNTASMTVNVGTSTNLSLSNTQAVLGVTANSKLTLTPTAATLNRDSHTYLSLTQGTAGLYATGTAYASIAANAVTIQATGTNNLTLGSLQAKLSAGTNQYLNITSSLVDLRSSGTSYFTLDSTGARVQADADTFLSVNNSGLEFRQSTVSYFTLNSSGVSLHPSNSSYMNLTATSLELRPNNTQYLTMSDTAASLHPSNTSYVNVNNNQAEIHPNNTSYITVATGLTSIVNPTQVKIETPITQFGSLYDSSIYVGAIWNYNGTGAPLFPEGTQYGDLTVQKTAWQGYDQGLIP